MSKNRRSAHNALHACARSLYHPPPVWLTIAGARSAQHDCEPPARSHAKRTSSSFHLARDQHVITPIFWQSREFRLRFTRLRQSDCSCPPAGTRCHRKTRCIHRPVLPTSEPSSPAAAVLSVLKCRGEISSGTFSRSNQPEFISAADRVRGPNHRRKSLRSAGGFLPGDHDGCSNRSCAAGPLGRLDRRSHASASTPETRLDDGFIRRSSGCRPEKSILNGPIDFICPSTTLRRFIQCGLTRVSAVVGLSRLESRPHHRESPNAPVAPSTASYIPCDPAQRGYNTPGMLR